MIGLERVITGDFHFVLNWNIKHNTLYHICCDRMVQKLIKCNSFYKNEINVNVCVLIY